MPPLLSYAEAAEQVQIAIRGLAGLPPAEGQSAFAAPERVPLARAAGRVLGEAICADRDQPPFPRSTRDGFACRAAEANAHPLLLLAGQVRAGQEVGGGPGLLLGRGEAWEIMTGAPVPSGADAVFMVEHAEQTGNFVRLRAPRTIEAGENVVAQGAEAREGEALIAPGARLGAAQIALAAQCGCWELAVAPRPRVAILSTGDELVPVESSPGPSQIRNSNAPMLAALVEAAGGEAMVSAAVPDRDAELDAAIGQALEADLLLVTGGISAGRFDLVEGALSRAGAQFLFRGVAMQPGKPVAFGQAPRAGRRALPLFALPGNPISSAATFHLFAAPMLAALGGDCSPLPRFALARLQGGWRGKPGLTRFLPAWCDFGPEPQARLIPWQGSGDLAAFARSNCFAVVPSDAQEIPEGSLVQILLT